MIVRGFRPVAWVAAVGSAALSCYMLSLQVAAERADLTGIERQIVSARQDIRTLQTELGTRGRLQQLEQWNAEVLALSAPVAGQFVESNLSLARFDVRHRNVVDDQVRLASVETAPAAPRPAEPEVRLAAAERPAVQRPLLRRAGLEVPPAPASASAPSAAMPALAAAAPMRTVTSPAHATFQARALLDQGTLRELRDESRSERGGSARN